MISSPFTKHLLGFIRRAGSERSTAKVLAEMSRFIGESLAAHRVTVYLTEGDRLIPYVSEFASGIRRPHEFLPREAVEAFDVQPLLLVALRAEGSLSGVLVVEGDVSDLRVRRDDVRQFAEFVALALENARAFERENERVREAEALLERTIYPPTPLALLRRGGEGAGESVCGGPGMAAAGEPPTG